MSSDQGVKIVSEIPVEDWTSGARFTGRPGAPYNGRIILSVPRTAPIRKSTVKTATESKIVYMSSGIDLSKVTFGPTAKALDYFYFTDADGNAYRSAADVPNDTTITGANYHHERTPGFAVILK